MQAPAGTGIRAQASAEDISFYFSVPGSGAWLLLAFSGPGGPLAPAIADLFDAIAATLRWGREDWRTRQMLVPLLFQDSG